MAILLLGFAAVLTDVTVHKIPNVILVLWIIQEIIFKGLEQIPISKSFLVTHIFFLILVIIILVPFYRIGALGAGDIKFMILVAASLKNELEFVMLTFAVASVIATIKMVFTGKLTERFKTFGSYAASQGLWKKKIGYHDNESMDDRLKVSIHFGIPIFIATLPMVLKEVGLW